MPKKFALGGKNFEAKDDEFDIDDPETWEFDDEEEEEEESEEEEEEEDSEYDETEEVFDSFSDGKGWISQKKLMQALRSLGFFFTKKEVKDLIKDYDEDSDGKLDLDEFTSIVSTLRAEDEEEEEEDEEEEEEEEEEDNVEVPHVAEEAAPPAKPSTAAGGGKKPKVITKALFIGINYPGSDCPLNGCCNDVRTMHRLLKHLKVSITEERVLVDEKDFPGRTGHPTKAKILDGMKWLTQGAKPGDTFFLHYSGHGTQQEAEADTTEDDGMDEAICPSDYDSHGIIIDDVIHKICVRTLPAGSHLTAVFDCCHSGTIMDLPFVFRATKENVAASRDIKARGAVFTQAASGSSKIPPIAASIVMFSGCKDSQTSADVQGDKGAGGACTNAIAEVLTPKPKLTLVELLERMREVLSRDKMTQIPQLSSSHPLTVTSKFNFVGM